MARIRGQKKTQEKYDLNAPLPSPTPSVSESDWWENFPARFSGYTPDSLFKVSRKTFEYICGLVEEEMPTGQNYRDQRRESLALNDRVAIALTRLCTGEPFEAISNLFRVSLPTSYQITWRFVEAIEKIGFHYLHWPKTEEQMMEIKSRFEGISGLPNCCGAIDTTKIMFCLSSVHAQRKIWCDRENNPCMILQAVVDPNMRFLDIIAGLPGCLSEPDALYEWSLFNLCEEGKRLNGKKLKLAETNEEIGEYIVGDGGFPLLPWLLTPYNEKKKLSDVQQDFNERHYATWKVAKMAFARLKETWKITQGVLWTPDKLKLPRIIYACCVLHNIMIDQNDAFVMRDESFLQSHDNGPQAHQPKCQFLNKTASIQRDNLALYLSSKPPPFSSNGVESVAKHVDLFEDDVLIEDVDTTGVDAADPVIIEDATVPLHPVEVISSIPVILDPNTATNQQGRTETSPVPSTLGIESSQPPDLAITRSNLSTPVKSRNERHRAHNRGSRGSHQESADKWLMVGQTVCRKLDASISEWDKLHELVQELKESNKKLTESAAQKDAGLLSLRSEYEALKLETSEIAVLQAKVTDLKEEIATRDSQAKAYLAEAEQAKDLTKDLQKALEDLTKDLKSEKQSAAASLKRDVQSAVLRYNATPQMHQQLSVLCHAVLQYGYTYGVNESKAQVLDLDISSLPHYKKLYNPRAGEIYDKLYTEFANGEDIAKKYPLVYTRPNARPEDPSS